VSFFSRTINAQNSLIVESSNTKNVGTEAHCVVILEKNNDVIVERVESINTKRVGFIGQINDENAQNSWSTNNWKKIPPTKGENDTKTVLNTTNYWCTKCKSWNTSHKSAEHKSKKKRKTPKKSRPLVPFTPIRTPGRTPNPKKGGLGTHRNNMAPASKKLIF